MGAAAAAAVRGAGAGRAVFAVQATTVAESRAESAVVSSVETEIMETEDVPEGARAMADSTGVGAVKWGERGGMRGRELRRRGRRARR